VGLCVSGKELLGSNTRVLILIAYWCTLSELEQSIVPNAQLQCHPYMQKAKFRFQNSRLLTFVFLTVSILIFVTAFFFLTLKSKA
jgi:hypothetical protein